LISSAELWREWRVPLLVLLATVFFIPMRRYALPSSLPFHLEPYRPLVALVLALWILGLLMRRVTFRHTSLGVPMTLFAFAVLISLAANPHRIVGETVKFLTLFSTFFLAYLLVVCIVRRREDIDTVVKVIVSFGAVLGVLAVIEARTGFTPFTHLDRIVPFLNALPVDLTTQRGVRLRSFASSEHPIALGALLVMLMPFAVYLGASTKKLIWWACAGALVIGATSTVSRTAVVMLLIELTIIAIVRWRDVRRLWPLVFPLVALVHFALPGTIGTLQSAFFPTGGLVAEQETHATSLSTAGRVADIAPSLDQFEERPLAGGGLGARITTGPNANGRLLDNQWLGLIVDVGLLGTLAFAWLLLRSVRGQLHLARSDPEPSGYLPLACAAAVAGYGIGMLTYDAFSFTQTTFVFFVILGLGASYQLAVEPAREAVRTRLPLVARPLTAPQPSE
jgi:hypothetical protein